MFRKSVSWIVRAVLVLLSLSSSSKLPAAVSGVNRWSPIGPAGVSVVRLAIDPKSPLTVYAAGGPAGLFRSTDGGATWSRLVIDATANPAIWDVAVDPSNTWVVFARGRGFDGGFFKSTDGGATWAAAGAGLASSSTIVVSASQPTTIYVGVYRSTDGGQTFSAIPLPFNPQFQNLGVVAVDPKNASTIYLIAFGGRQANGAVYKSTDAGVSWTNTLVPTGRPAVLTIDPVNSAVVYVTDAFLDGTFKTIDGGATWVTFFLGGPAQTRIVVDPAAPSTLYAVVVLKIGVRSLVQSFDGGATWKVLPDPLPQAAPSYDLKIDPTGLRLYLANSDGAFVRRTEDRPLLLLNGRFQVALDARDPRTGRVTAGVAITKGDSWGYFSLPEFTGDASFPEVVVKMADATALPALGGTFWFFHSSLTDVEYALIVTDTVNGTTRTYRNVSLAAGQLCGAADTSAFPP